MSGPNTPMDGEDFRAAASDAVNDIIEYLEKLEDRPVVCQAQPGFLRQLIPTEAPQEGEPWKNIRKDIHNNIIPGLTHWQHPNFFAFFPCPVSYPSILGEMYSAGFTAAAFNWICSPACTELETIVMDWLAMLLGLPAAYLSTGPGGGVIQGTASETIHVMMVAAADRYIRKVEAPVFANGSEEEREEALISRRAKLVALASGSAHSATKKAARILGLRFRSIAVSKETNYALTGAAVAAAIQRCEDEGLEPFFLTTTLGTTDTCAVDDFSSIVIETRRHPGLWVHVDAAYAGAALVCPEYQHSIPIATFAEFHSFNVNMHKWLLTNNDASCAFVSDRKHLTKALGGDELHVYNNEHSTTGLVTDYRDWQVALGRRFRALKIWFVLRTYGKDGLQRYIRRTLGMGEYFAEEIRGKPDLFEIITPPAFALTVFRMRGGNRDERDRRTKSLYDKLNKSGKLWLTSTQLEEETAIRFMTANHLTTHEHVVEALKLIVATAETIMADA